MKNKNWHNPMLPRTAKKVLTIYSSKRFLISLSITRYFKPAKFVVPSVSKGLGGVAIMKLKRTRWQRFAFWILRLRFKELTIKELKKLSATEQQKYLNEKYRLYGIVPYLKNHVGDK